MTTKSGKLAGLTEFLEELGHTHTLPGSGVFIQLQSDGK